MQKRGFIIGATLAIIVAGAGGAVAAIPGTDGVITSCRNSAGNIQVIDEAATCPAATTKLQWNQRGPLGPAGPRGLTGPPGPAGSGVQWARTHADRNSDNVPVAASDSTTNEYWTAPGRRWLWFPNVDLTKCAITTGITNTNMSNAPVFVTATRMYGWITLQIDKLQPDGTLAGFDGYEVDVSLSCKT